MGEADEPEKEKPAEPPASGKLMLWFGLLCLASVSLINMNKWIMTGFHRPNTLLCIQNGLTIVFNLLRYKMGYCEMKPWKLDHFKMFLAPTIIFTFMLFCSLQALPYIAVATTIIFRNIGTVVVAIGEYLAFKRQYTFQQMVSIWVIVVGSVIYAGTDINYDPIGYFWITLNTVAFAACMLVESYAVKEIEQSSEGISCYQNLMSLPICFFLMISTGELDGMVAECWSLPTAVKAAIFISGGWGCLLSICYMTLYKISSPTSITIAVGHTLHILLAHLSIV
jgi:drug/metabolite transporter (DMT)-like permease